MTSVTPPAKQLFDSLDNYAKLNELIDSGECEGVYLECKAPSSPQLSRDQKVTLAMAISGFSNTEGGIIIWGMSTTKHAHHNLDVITQIEPIGACKHFAQQVQKAIPALTIPAVTTAETKCIFREANHTKGVAITYIPKNMGDPIQSLQDDRFYFRSGDEFTIAPYEMIKRLFAATESPDLNAGLLRDIIELQADGTWNIPINLWNDSSAVAERTKIMVEIVNPEVCKNVILLGYKDVSKINLGKKLFIHDEFSEVIYRGLNNVAGALQVVMQPNKRLLKIQVSLFANKMRPKSFNFSIKLYKKKFTVTETPFSNLY
ncbi:MAG TPA: ATP-binding protein [Acidobacteriota bacterium]|nr:ATP-binding protein [Acidobacteriota bacterium]